MNKYLNTALITIFLLAINAVFLQAKLPVLASDIQSECKNKDINACNQWVEQESSSEAYFYRAIIKSINQDLEGALVDYDQAIKLNPDDFRLYVNRADLKLFLEDYEGANADLNKVISHCQQILIQNPYHIQTYYDLGIALQKKGDYSNVIICYEQILSLDPNDALAYYNRGIVKDKLKDYKGAIEDFSKAKELDPNLAKKVDIEIEKIKKLQAQQ